MKRITVRITEAKCDGQQMAVIHNLESDCEQVYELNRIMHALAFTQITVEQTNKGFTYVFPLKLQ